MVILAELQQPEGLYDSIIEKIMSPHISFLKKAKSTEE